MDELVGWDWASGPTDCTAKATSAFDSYTTGMEHSPTSATGTAWERTAWHATQRVEWNAHDRASRQ